MYDQVRKEQTLDKLMQTGALTVTTEARKYLILLRTSSEKS